MRPVSWVFGVARLGLTFLAVGVFALAGVSVAHGAQAVQVSVGASHSCAVLAGGGVQCWGDGGGGRLGNGSTGPSSTPVDVQGLAGAVAVSAGGAHTCAVVAGGAVKCWGSGDNGEMGNGADAGSSTPVDVQGVTGATAIVAATGFTCALVSGGAVKCWGFGHEGRLGNASTANSNTPVDVQGLTDAIAISTRAREHICAVRSGGAVRCWGRGDNGELGNGSSSDSSTPFEVPGLTGAAAISTGSGYTCALLAGGTAKCWGYGGRKNLGNGTTSNSPTPVDVQGLTGAASISSGFDHSCSVVSGGTAKCWGGDGASPDGKLGNGADPGSGTLVDVQGMTGAVAVSAGDRHTCALLAGGAVSCWGYGVTGRLGNGVMANSNTPVAVQGLTGPDLTPPAPPVPPVTAPPAPPVPAPVTAPRPPAAPAPKAVAITQIATLPTTKACVSRRKFPIRMRNVKKNKVVRAEIKLNRKQVRSVTGKALGLPIDLRGLPKGRFTVEIITTDSAGRRVVGKRTYRTCAPRKR